MVPQTLQGLCRFRPPLACRLARAHLPPNSITKTFFRSQKNAFKPRMHITRATDDFDSQLENDINESTSAVDDMVQEISKNLFIDTATAFVVGRFQI